MNGSPTIDCAGTMVVLEGAARLRWRRAAAAEWVPTAIWPTAAESIEMRGRITRREPVLVLLGSTPDTVEVLAEELAGAPDSVAALAIDPDADLVTLVIPFLDWLPADLRSRALNFGNAVRAQVEATPRGLLPSVLLEPVDPRSPWLRFAWQLGSRHPLDLGVIARHAFPSIGCRSQHRIEQGRARAC